ncbi:endonuclease/exonuclease/phosphatase family protein [Maribacter antarcticus]|uniref:endonuclease/exonuclease/phosphatase family protein n=1 Tax=Maribacter antarcticus TaxID=505250 RepID=UPI00146F98B8|nr:endonuclease/exonuclease/phosphatase family protein [Maribacter antarcticus]
MVIPIAVLVYSYVTLGSFVKLRSTSTKADENISLRLMSFNSQGYRGKANDWERSVGDSIAGFINEERPDIICFQEFDYKKIRSDDFEAYPFSFVDFEFGKASETVIQAIYSKYKIVDQGLLHFPYSDNSAVYADIIYKTDTLRIYNLHLQSLRIRPGSIKLERSDKLLARLRKSFQKQQQQSEIVRNHMANSPYKNIVVGDFNNNQFSSVYFNLKRDLKDTFIEAGSGYGGTINFWKFPFRIDFILVDPSFEVVGHRNYDIGLSDHDPIMASIKIPFNK